MKKITIEKHYIIGGDIKWHVVINNTYMHFIHCDSIVFNVKSNTIELYHRNAYIACLFLNEFEQFKFKVIHSDTVMANYLTNSLNDFVVVFKLILNVGEING